VARKRHPKKEVEAALQYAEHHGWTVTDTASGHRWGVAVCPGDCTPPTSIWSTPRVPANHARHIRRNVDRCPHAGEER
jgi:hypothetical protein